MKKTLISIFAVLSLGTSVFSQTFNLDAVGASGLPSVETLPAASAPGLKDWTIIFYATTKDKLKYSFLNHLLEMKNVGALPGVNVAVEGSLPVELPAGDISTVTVRLALGAPWSEEKIEQVVKDGVTPQAAIKESLVNAFAEDIVSREENVDTGDWRRVAAFARWAKAAYPARRYAFVIFGHGNGFFDPKKPSNKNTLQDTDTHNYVTVPEMRLLMEEAGRMDIFVMESCLMQMAETAWQVKDHTDVIVGSSELMWSVGYDLAGLIRQLDAAPAIPAPDLGAWLAEGYVSRVKAVGKSGHASVLLTDKLPVFAEKLDSWADAVMSLKDRRLLYPALANVARFDIFGFTAAPGVSTAAPAAAALNSVSGDIYDFVSLVSETLPPGVDGGVRARGAELMSYISGSLLYGYYSHGVNAAGYDYSRAHGISAHLPNQAFLDTPAARRGSLETPYWTIPFANETRWGDLLHWLYGHNTAAR